MMLSLLNRRPRLLNALHAVHLARPRSGTTIEELNCLARHAAGHRTAIEIGTHMGVSACVIAESIAVDGRVYCVDPWPRRALVENPSWLICDRELRRRGLRKKVEYIRRKSDSVEGLLPGKADFIFVDGDHSWSGLTTDWDLVQRILTVDGVVCLHDTTVPVAEPDRHPESVDFFREVIQASPAFVQVECTYSMNVMRRVGE